MFLVKAFRREDVVKQYNIHKDVKRINSEQENPWYLIIDNKVYDVKDFIPDHPGGAVILTHIGKDATGKKIMCHACDSMYIKNLLF